MLSPIADPIEPVDEAAHGLASRLLAWRIAAGRHPALAIMAVALWLGVTMVLPGKVDASIPPLGSAESGRAPGELLERSQAGKIQPRTIPDSDGASDQPGDPGAGTSAPPPPSTPLSTPLSTLARASAEDTLLRNLAEEGRVETQAPRPGLALYLSDAGRAVVRWIGRLLTPYLAKAGFLDRLVRSGLGLLLAGLALFFLVLLVVRHFSRSAATPTGPKTSTVKEEVRPPIVDREAELLSLLDANQIEAALEAFWWWLAQALGAADADSSWTTRELVSRAGRRDLLPDIRPYDRLVYGGEGATTAQLRELHSTTRLAISRLAISRQGLTATRLPSEALR